MLCFFQGKAVVAGVEEQAEAEAVVVAVVVEVVEAVDQENADINPVHELWVVLKPPKELGLGRH